MYKQGGNSLSYGFVSVSFQDPKPNSPSSSHSQRLYSSHHREYLPAPNPNQPSLAFALPKKMKCDVRERMWVSLNSNDQKKKSRKGNLLPPNKRETLEELQIKQTHGRPGEVVGNRSRKAFSLERHADISHRSLQRAGVLRHRHGRAVDHRCHRGEFAPFLLAVARWPSL